MNGTAGIHLNVFFSDIGISSEGEDWDITTLPLFGQSEKLQRIARSFQNGLKMLLEKETALLNKMCC